MSPQSQTLHKCTIRVLLNNFFLKQLILSWTFYSLTDSRENINCSVNSSTLQSPWNIWVFDPWKFIDLLVHRIWHIRDERACKNSKFSMENVLKRFFLFITCDASKKPNERVFFQRNERSTLHRKSQYVWDKIIYTMNDVVYHSWVYVVCHLHSMRSSHTVRKSKGKLFHLSIKRLKWRSKFDRKPIHRLA